MKKKKAATKGPPTILRYRQIIQILSDQCPHADRIMASQALLSQYDLSCSCQSLSGIK